MKWFFCTLLVALAWNKSHAAALEIREGDHICIIGNKLAESMQFEGHNHWETLLYQRFPKHKLVVRNLAWPDDEVTLRPRREGFCLLDEDLALHKADIIIAFFGFHESAKGEEGLPQFKSDLEEWIKHTKAQNYSGKRAPGIALVSPMAIESSSTFQGRDQVRVIPEVMKSVDARLGIRLLSLREAFNSRLALYTDAMREVAERNGIVFSNVFHQGSEFFPQNLTSDGVHLNAEGDKIFAPYLDASFFGSDWDPPSTPQPGPTHYLHHYAIPAREELRQEIETKNKLWYERYHLTNGQPVPGDKTQRETLDALVAQRDERIWQLAQSDEASVTNKSRKK